MLPGSLEIALVDQAYSGEVAAQLVAHVIYERAFVSVLEEYPDEAEPSRKVGMALLDDLADSPRRIIQVSHLVANMQIQPFHELL